MQSARVMSIKNDSAAATTEARSITGNTSAVVTVSSGGCDTGNTTVTVTIEGTRSTITGMFGANFTVRGKGQVRCE